MLKKPDTVGLYDDVKFAEKNNVQVKNPEIFVWPDRIVTNDNSHGAHDESNPDTGETSQFALDLAAQMEKLGFETVVSRLE